MRDTLKSSYCRECKDMDKDVISIWSGVRRATANPYQQSPLKMQMMVSSTPARIPLDNYAADPAFNLGIMKGRNTSNGNHFSIF